MKHPSVTIKIKMGSPPVPRNLSYTQTCELVRSLLAAGQYEIAAQLCSVLVNAVPDDPETLLFAADVLLQGKDASAAANYLERAAGLCGITAAVLLMRSRIALEMNDGDRAIESLGQLIELDKNNHQAYIERGDAFLILGKAEQAKSDYSQAFELNNLDTRSLLQLSRLPGAEISQEQISLLESLLSGGRLQQPEQIYAHFVLANAYDRLEDIPRHFDHLKRGNELARGHHHHDPLQHRAIVEKVIDHFPSPFFARKPPPSRHQQRIIFILGMPRSGSTLIEQILCAHSGVRSVGENHYMHQAMGAFLQMNGSGLDFPGAINQQNMAHLGAIADSYLKYIGAAATDEVVVDKSWGDYLYPGVISLIFPNARFVHSRRHPVATCYGCYKVLFGSGLVPFAYSFDQLVSQYRDVDNILEHWKAVLPGKFHTLQYESLVQDQESQTRRLLAFCGLNWEEACLAFHDNTGAIGNASNFQVRSKLYSHAVDEWRKYEEYLGPLMELVETQAQS